MKATTPKPRVAARPPLGPGQCYVSAKDYARYFRDVPLPFPRPRPRLVTRRPRPVQVRLPFE
jgi:hypothetical protein